MRTLLRNIGFLVSAYLFLNFFLSQPSEIQAHVTTSNHLVCANSTTPGVDIVQVDIRTHLKSGAVPSGAYDGYQYNDPPTDPRGVVHPTVDPGARVLYRVISQPPSASYTAIQKIAGESDLTCNIDLTCKDSCDTPIESGTCNSGCNITLASGSCPQYNKSTTYQVNSGDADTVIRWDDGSANTMVTPQPSSQNITHTFTNPGKYDVHVRCGSQVCSKRFHVVCQDGTASPSPTPLPTATPTPTGVSACITPLSCSHPCACDTGSSSYINAGCGSVGNTTDYSGGYGSSHGTTDGAACSPGLVCCQPAVASSQVWFKVKDAAFHEIGGLANSVPVNATTFDASDTGLCNPDDVNAENCNIVGINGLLSADGGINLGMSVPNHTLWALGNDDYQKSSQFTPDTYIQYLLSRKETVSISDPEDVEQNKINFMNGNETISVIDDNGMQGKAPFVLLVDNGSLRFDLSNKFNSSNKPMVIVVDGTIEFKSSMTEVNGIFIAKQFDFAYDTANGSYSTTPFIVNGNIVSLYDSECTAKRKRTDQTKPTCFFKFDFVEQFVPVINLFSARTYRRTVY